MMKNWLAAGAVALSVGMTSTIAHAQSTTVPGEQVGLAVGAPLPEGIYAINTFTYRRTDGRNDADTAVNIPVLVWSTPLVPFGGRIELLVAPPTVFVFTRNPAGVANKDVSINVGTFVGGIWAFDLGGNFGVSLLGGAYLNDLDGDRGSLCTPGAVGPTLNFNAANRNGCTPLVPQLSSNTYRFGVAGSYTGDGWNITANLTANIYDSPGRFPGQVGFAVGPIRLSDALNFDLTATKTFGNFEIGAVGYGTYNFDISPGSAAFGNRGRFALGGLVGYDFKVFKVQAYVARDVVTGTQIAATAFRPARADYSTDGWVRFIIPLYSPAAAAPIPAPLVRKY